MTRRDKIGRWLEVICVVWTVGVLVFLLTRPHVDASVATQPLPAMQAVSQPPPGRFDDEVEGIQRVVDGDTVDLTIQVHINLVISDRCRVLGVNTPERGQPGFGEATAFTTEWLNTHEERVQATKEDNFGRLLCTLYEPTTQETLAEALIAAGLGAPA